LLLDGTKIVPTRQDSGMLVFDLPAGTWHDLRLCSRSEVAAWIHGNADNRRIGLEVVLRGPHAEMTICAHANGFCNGFYGREMDDQHRWRWTNGEAHFPATLLAAIPKGCELMIRLRTGMTYWLPGLEKAP
jgi:hypothetical protein